MVNQLFSPQSPPSFCSTALALPLSPGRKKESRTHSTIRRPSMPLAPATLHLPKRVAPAPAAHLPTRPVTQPSPYPAHLPARNQTRSPAHAPAPLTPFVLVKRRQGLGHACAGMAMHCRGALKALPTSVLVKRVLGRSVFLAGASASRVTPTCVAWTHATGHRVEAQCWTRWLEGKRLAGFREAVARPLRKARLIVLVKSFSSPCPAPLPQQRLPGVGLALSGWGLCRA